MDDDSFQEDFKWLSIFYFIFNLMSEKRKYVALTADLPNSIKWFTGGLAAAVGEVI